MTTVLLLICSNIFMTIAWYGNLKFPKMPLLIAIGIGWGIALIEYCFAVPANRYGYAHGFSGGQLKIIQEVITLGVFVPFAVGYMRQPVTLNFLWAGLCLMGAVYFIFRA